MRYLGAGITESRINNTLNKNTFKMEDLSELFLFLVSPKIKGKRITELISSVMESLTIKEIIQLDKSFRSKTSFLWSTDWRLIKVNRITRNASSRIEEINLLALSTCHPDGYFREKALDKLIIHNDERSIPYLAIRTNDWVEIISKKAKSALMKYVEKRHFASLMKHYSILLHSSKYDNGIYEEINDKLKSMFSYLSYYEVLQSISIGDEKGKLFCYKALTERKLINIRDLFEIIQKEKSPFVRVKAFSELIKKSSTDVLYKNRDVLLSAKNPSIREKVIVILYEEGYYKTHTSLKPELLNNSAKVRETVVFYMNKIGSFNFIKFYKNELELHHNNHIALIGILENGTSNEIDIAKKALSNMRQKVVKAALSFFASSFYKYQDIIIEYLQDSRKGVSNHARKIMIRNRRSIIFSDVFLVFKSSDNIMVKKNCMYILKKAQKWEALIYILEFILDRAPEISEIGKNHYQDWYKRMNKSYVLPTARQVNIIKKLIRDNRISKDIADNIMFTIN